VAQAKRRTKKSLAWCRWKGGEFTPAGKEGILGRIRKGTQNEGGGTTSD